TVWDEYNRIVQGTNEFDILLNKDMEELTKITDEKLNSLYTNNPDQNQFWPIWQVFIDNSNGMLDANLLD
ncbi:MAG: hypothetical protein P1P88_11730, partial [Bacteroidales bacterium]|nr:hypothetical protein [Bacteroidales bacterium]